MPPNAPPPVAADASAPPAKLPESPSQHFANLVDSDPLTSQQPGVRPAYWQSDTNEGIGLDEAEEEDLNALRKRVDNLEKEHRKHREAGHPKKSTGKFEHNLFGRIQADGVTFSQDAANKAQLGDIPNGVDFRRVRLGMQGPGYEILFYRLEADFVQPDEVTKKRPRLTDAYFEVRELPWLGTFRVGQYREPYSVERLTSGNDTTFLERGLPQAFHTSRNMGVMLYDSSRNQKWYWWNGIFAQRATNFGEFFSNAPRLAYVNRIDWVPWYDEPSGGRYLAAIGSGYSFRNLAGTTQTFSSTPEVSLQFDATSVIPPFVTTGSMTVNTMQIFQAQAFTVLGPLSFQAEYYGTKVDQVNNPNVFLHGMYVFGSYFLTGEHRPYDRKQGIFTAVKPFADFYRVRTADRGICTGPGAWEVAARFSSLNLSDRNIQGGRLNDVSLGVNWYLNFQTKIMFNYVHAFLNRHNAPSNADVFETRAQVVW
ncbi:MAG TPA: porin [Pirellulales bacterium]|nr:porin [Pirellulales bacterium]